MRLLICECWGSGGCADKLICHAAMRDSYSRFSTNQAGFYTDYDEIRLIENAEVCICRELSFHYLSSSIYSAAFKEILFQLSLQFWNDFLLITRLCMDSSLWWNQIIDSYTHIGLYDNIIFTIKPRGIPSSHSLKE